MKNKILLIIFPIICIVGLLAVVSLDKHQVTVDFRKAVSQALKDGGFDVGSFWTTVDEDDIAEDVSKSADLAETAGAAVNEVVEENTEAAATKEKHMPAVSVEKAEEVQPQEETFEIQLKEQGNITTSVGVGKAETIYESNPYPNGDESDESETAAPSINSDDKWSVTYDEYMDMSAAEREEFKSKWDTPGQYQRWYEGMMAAHNADDTIIRKSISGNGDMDVSELESEAIRRQQ